LLKINNIELAILKARMRSEPIQVVDKKKYSVLADVAIFKIAAIVGLSLPTSEKFADVLNEELLILLTEFGYNDLTFDELVLAFRVNSQYYRTPQGDTINPIIPYSSFFSINYASAVLNNYKRIRSIVDMKVIEQIGEDIFEKYKKRS
jgi:hypothetical protein